MRANIAMVLHASVLAREIYSSCSVLKISLHRGGDILKHQELGASVQTDIPDEASSMLVTANEQYPTRCRYSKKLHSGELSPT